MRAGTAPAPARVGEDGARYIPQATVGFIAAALQRCQQAFIALDGKAGVYAEDSAVYDEEAGEELSAVVNNSLQIYAIDALRDRMKPHGADDLVLGKEAVESMFRALHDLTARFMALDEFKLSTGESVGVSDVIELGLRVIDALGPCPKCRGERWVCERHPDLPWAVPGGCDCSEGMPCSLCNPCDHYHLPILQPGFQVQESTRPERPTLGVGAAPADHPRQ